MLNILSEAPTGAPTNEWLFDSVVECSFQSIEKSIPEFSWQATQSQVVLFQNLFVSPQASVKVEKGSHYKSNLMNKEIGKSDCSYSSYGVICDQSNHFSKKKMQHSS